jgi:hypothetical protein
MDDEEDILPMDSGPVRPELVSEPTIVDEPEEREAQPRAPDGKFASKGEGDKPAEEAASAPPAPEPEAAVPVKALQDERRKRQELEVQLEAMRQQAQQQPQQPAPEFWDNPNATLEHQFQRFGQQLLQQFQEQQVVERINVSETAARAKHADYDDAFHAFRQAVQVNPVLVQQMRASNDPGEFAYNTGKKALELDRVGSIDEMLKAERAKWEAELLAKAPKPTFPTSTASDGSVSNRGAVFQAPDFRLPMDS